jgi:hypothetical protein
MSSGVGGTTTVGAGASASVADDGVVSGVGGGARSPL